jgi:hypothetical protein
MVYTAIKDAQYLVGFKRRNTLGKIKIKTIRYHFQLNKVELLVIEKSLNREK